MQPLEPEEALKELVAREETRTRPADPELERAEARRRQQIPPPDDPPEADWLRSNWGWLILAAIPVGLVAWVIYVALA
jgi:cytochrome c-type biogenesis protein CcmH/NrfG